MWHLVLVAILFLTGCGSGAVVFAPTPSPPDLSPLRYEHPSGSFSVVVPRNWPVFTQHATTLAAVSFAAPDSSMPVLTFAVVNVGDPPDSSAFGAMIDRYQQEIRADAGRYKQEDRQAMGDGSWRMTGLRAAPGGETQQINTFIERSGSFIGVAEVIVPDDPALVSALQTVLNTFQMNAGGALEPTDLAVLVSLAASSLEVLNVGTWTTPGGVFYITGEVANYGTMPAVDVPVQAVLLTGDGLPVAEAVDFPMGYAVLPGGFAPFSLRFGQGQSALTTSYTITLGGEEWTPDTSIEVYGPADLSWIDESTFDENGELVISGTLTNIGGHSLREPRVSATVFDANRNVIGARFVDLDGVSLNPNESSAFSIRLPEIGGVPAQYVVNVQALP